MTATYAPALADEQIEDCLIFSDDDLGFARAVERAAIEAYQRRQWHPIETAPKGGRTLLLGRHNPLGNWRTMRGQWMGEDYIAEHWEDPDDVEPGWFETSVEADDPPNCWRIEPTHWQSLPPPPSEQSG